MDENGFKNFIIPKLSSLVIIGMFFSTGSFLIKGENNYSFNFIIGLIFLSIGGILAFSIFFTYIKDEHYEKMIKQLEKVNKTLEKNFMNVSGINRKMEDSTRETMGQLTEGYYKEKQKGTAESNSE